MSHYERIMPESRIMEEFPTLSQEDLDAVDVAFRDYMVFERTGRGRRVWTGCCHRCEVLEDLPRKESYDMAAARHAGHGDVVACPFCGELLHVIALHKFRSGRTVERYVPVLFLHVSEDGETVWAQGYWARREPIEDPYQRTQYMPTRVYRFRRGTAEEWTADHWSWHMYPKTLRGGFVHEPFTTGGIYAGNEAYRVVGMDRLAGSFLRWTRPEEPVDARAALRWHDEGLRLELVRYLGLAARWPKNVEMLRRAGVVEPIQDWIWAKRKNTDVIRWGKTGPAAFRLSKEELRAFLATGDRRLDTLRVYRAADGRLSMEECEQLLRTTGLKDAKALLQRGKEFGLPPGRLLRYLARQSPVVRLVGAERLTRTIIHIWLDWLDLARALGCDLTNEVIQTPKDLIGRHDEAARQTKTLADERLARAAEKRYLALQERYGYTDGTYLIRAPYTAEEIVSEGKSLRHCVGGYAARHAADKVTILFLRAAGRPEEPLATIEMDGAKLRQVHGYNNDWGRTTSRKQYGAFLDGWLDWVAAGSKRDRDGAPRPPKKEGKTA